MSGITSSIQRNNEQNALEIIEFYIDEILEDGSTYRSYYGMNVAKVLEIIRMPKTTMVPGDHHPAVLGSFNLRNRVLPLVDLGVWLGKAIQEGSNDKVIVSEFSGVVAAFVVTGVTRIHRMTWQQIEPPGKYLQSFSHGSVTGVLRMEDRILFLLDMEYIIGTMDESVRLDSRVEFISGGGESGKGFHVLVVDDSPSVRTVIKHCLETEQYTVSTATSGVEGWDLVQQWARQAEEEGRPITDFVHLIISDIEMPEMDGHTFTAEVKKHPVLSKLPVILFSAIISDVVRKRGEDSGADDQIAKPDLPELTARTRVLIDKYADRA